jgi:YihY family inner membrane protein
MIKAAVVFERCSRTLRFTTQVLRNFRRNQGMLLSGAIAYYTVLSVVPMALLAVIVLTHILDEQQLLQIMAAYLEMVIPGYAATLTGQVQAFLDHRNVVGLVGFLAMLFFSSMAFAMLENAMSLIFHHRFGKRRRHLLVSAVIPYLFLCLIALGIILVSVVIGVIETCPLPTLSLFGRELALTGGPATIVYLAGLVGEFLILSTVYLILPTVRIPLRHALIGGFTATILWEISRRVLVWYYASISMVNLIYGPIAVVIGALLCVEVAAIIILLGAQVIAELQAGREGDTHAGELSLSAPP